jgi:hypothetical protein
MKRTLELTAIHYRRLVKRSAPPSIQNLRTQSHCPVCGSPWGAVPVDQFGDNEGPKAAQGMIRFRAVPQEPEKRCDEDSLD